MLGRDDGAGGVGWQARKGVGVRALGVEVAHVADEGVVIHGVDFLLGEALDRAAQVPVPHVLDDTLHASRSAGLGCLAGARAIVGAKRRTVWPSPRQISWLPVCL